MSWSFRAKHRADVNVDPVQNACFATEAFDDVTDAPVRETIQNPLDAADERDRPIELRFALGDCSGGAADFLAGL